MKAGRRARALGTHDPWQAMMPHEAVKAPVSKSSTELQTLSPLSDDGHVSKPGKLSCSGSGSAAGSAEIHHCLAHRRATAVSLDFTVRERNAPDSDKAAKRRSGAGTGAVREHARRDDAGVSSSGREGDQRQAKHRKQGVSREFSEFRRGLELGEGDETVGL